MKPPRQAVTVAPLIDDDKIPPVAPCEIVAGRFDAGLEALPVVAALLDRREFPADGLGVKLGLRAAKLFPLFRPPLGALKIPVGNEHAAAGFEAEFLLKLARTLLADLRRQGIRVCPHPLGVDPANEAVLVQP